jgi:hypothetical protein
MTRFLEVLATLKFTAITASAAFARGEMLPVILITVLFSLVQLGAKPVSHAAQASPIVSPSTDRSRPDQFN